MASLTGQVVKGYELRELIGAGGFGAVYRAFQPVIEREVAIKIILPQYANQPDFIRRFEAEAQVVARLEHFYIVPLYDFWRDPNGAYLVMRWLRGGNLRASLQNGPWELDAAARLLEQLAAALAVAHRNGVIHRDLKPDNILLDEDSNAYLADFGIAKDLLAAVDISVSEAVIGSPAYLSPEQIKNGPITARSDIYSLGIVLYETLTGHKPFEDESAAELLFKQLSRPLPSIRLHKPELPETIDAVIQRATSKDPDDRYPDTLSLAAAFRQVLTLYRRMAPHEGVVNITPIFDEDMTTEQLADIMPAPENPYKGLRAFQEADASDFFGRQALIERLVGRLNEKGHASRFLAVIGPSGSGKSSVVKAGLLPALRKNALHGSNAWFMVEMFPGMRPFEELEAALLRIATDPAHSLYEALTSSAEDQGLLRVVERLLPAGTELLLLIDQFEELFTLVESEDERVHFLRSLLVAVSAPGSRLRVIVTLRADFYDRPLLYPEFGELMRARTEVVLPLLADELEQAIVGPAKRSSLQLEPALVAAIMNDLHDQPGALPLLQYALTELFERRQNYMLTLNAYQDIGGVLGALARRADDLYEGLSPAGQQAARQLFLRLVTLGEGTEDTRRRVRQAELASIGEDGTFGVNRATNGLMQSVMDAFGKYRLLTFDRDPVTREPTVEVAHEALIRIWMRLREWLDESREDLRLHRRLTTAADEWLTAQHDPSFLATGARLQQFQEWLRSTRLSLNEQEMSYLNASIAEYQALQAQEEERQAHEDELERRSRDRLRALVIVLLGAVIGALALTGLALSQRQAAEENAENLATAVAVSDRSAAEANSLALAASAQRALSTSDTGLAIVLALEANRLTDAPVQAQRVLAEAAYAPGTRLRFIGHSNFVNSVAVSLDGRWVLSGSQDGTLILWDIRTGEEIRRFEGNTTQVNAAAFSPDGSMVLSGASSTLMILWDTTTGEELHRYLGASGVQDVAFTVDGENILSASGDGIIRMYDLEDGFEVRRFIGHQRPVYEMAMSPDGRTFLSASADGTIRLWGINTGFAFAIFQGHEGSVLSLAISPNGRTVLSGSSDNSMRLWDIQNGRELLRFFGHSGPVTGVAFSPDGTRALSGSNDGSVRLWDVATSRELVQLRGHNGTVTSVDFTADGREVLSGSSDSTLRLWDVSNGAELRRYSPTQPNDIDTSATPMPETFAVEVVEQGETDTNAIFAVALNPDGSIAASAGRDGVVTLWNADTGDIIKTLTGHEETISALTFSPDGDFLVSGSRDSSVRLWDVQRGREIRRFLGDNSPVTTVGFSPDARYIISGSRDASIRLWDIERGVSVQRYVANVDAIFSVAFSPDGRSAVFGAGNGNIRLWDIETGEEIRRFDGHSATVYSVAFSPDGRTVLSGSRDGSMRLWNVETGGEIRRFEGHEGAVYSVAFNPDGRTVLSGSGDNTLRLWEIESGEVLRRYDGHTDTVWSVAFASRGGGRTALSGSADGTMRLWRTDTLGGLIAWTYENRYVPELTCAEREQYRVEPLCTITDNPNSAALDITEQPE